MQRDWNRIFEAVHTEMQRGSVPQVHFDLHNALSSLQSQKPGFWDKPQEMDALLEGNPGVQTILQKYSSDSIVHAIRAIRYAAAAR